MPQETALTPAAVNSEYQKKIAQTLYGQVGLNTSYTLELGWTLGLDLQIAREFLAVRKSQIEALETLIAEIESECF